jgi:hypothetical protein
MAPHPLIEQPHAPAAVKVALAWASGLAGAGMVAAENAAVGLTLTGIVGGLLAFVAAYYAALERRNRSEIQREADRAKAFRDHALAEAENKRQIEEIEAVSLNRQMAEQTEKLNKLIEESTAVRAALEREQKKRHDERQTHNNIQLKLQVEMAKLQGRIEELTRDTQRAAHQGGKEGGEIGGNKGAQKGVAAAMDSDPALIIRKLAEDNDPTPPPL